MTYVFGSARTILAAALLVWLGLRGGLPALVADWRVAADGSQVDLMTREGQRYLPLLISLPSSGTVGYLMDEPPSDLATLRFMLAQYVLTPRLVVMGSAPTYVIVGREASVPEQDRRGSASRDPRLHGFTLYERVSNGMRVFRRLE